MRCPRRTPWTMLRTPVCFLSYRRLSPQFQFSLFAATLVYLSQCDTLAGWRGWWGVNIFEDARHSSRLYICKYGTLWSTYYKEVWFCRLGLGGCVEYWHQVHIRAVQLRGRNAENRIKITLETKCRKDKIARFTYWQCKGGSQNNRERFN